VDVIPDAGDA